MKSGLEDRNNRAPCGCELSNARRLNEVRPGRPEQSGIERLDRSSGMCLNEVRPGRPEQFAQLIAAPQKRDE